MECSQNCKNINLNAIPPNVRWGGGGIPVAEGLTADAFESYLSQIYLHTVKKARVNSNGVYNGKCRLIVQSRNFIYRVIIMWLVTNARSVSLHEQ